MVWRPPREFLGPGDEEETRHNSIEDSSFLSGFRNSQFQTLRLSNPLSSSAVPYQPPQLLHHQHHHHKESSVSYSPTPTPRASPAHLDLGLRLRSVSVQSYLTQIENKKNLREMVTAAEKV